MATRLLIFAGIALALCSCKDTTAPVTDPVSLTVTVKAQDGGAAVAVEATARKLTSEQIRYMWDCVPIPMIRFFTADGKEAQMVENFGICGAAPHPEDMPNELTSTIIFDGQIVNPAPPPTEIDAEPGTYTIRVRLDYLRGSSTVWESIEDTATFDWPPS
jgi:hypothetical protein